MFKNLRSNFASVTNDPTVGFNDRNSVCRICFKVCKQNILNPSDNNCKEM